MKKLLCTLLALVMILSFAGCKQKEQISSEPENSASVSESNTQASTEAPTQAPTEAPTQKPTEKQTQRPTEPMTKNKYAEINSKTGNILKAETDKKIWAGVVGDAYILLRNISESNEWGESGRVYELHCAQFAGQYSMWSDGYWELSEDGTKLTLTPKNQGENGTIGVDVGESKTYTGQNGIFTIDITFEQGGKATIKLDLNKAL